MHQLRPPHVVLACGVAVVWGVNFVAIDVALRQFPPLLLAALRFALVAFPLALFVKRPQVPMGWIIAVGLFLGVGNFGLLFIGIYLGMPAGLSSLLLQSQAVFTLALAKVLLGERLNRQQWLGSFVAIAGIGVVAGAGVAAPPAALLSVIAAAASWAMANICMRKIRSVPGLGLLVWSSAVPVLPLTLLSLLIEKPGSVLGALTTWSPAPAMALAYLVIAATLLGFGSWYALLRRYPAGVVAPYSMLVPVVGLIAAWIMLGERPNVVQLVGAVIVMVGITTATMIRSHPTPSALRDDRVPVLTTTPER